MVIMMTLKNEFLTVDGQHVTIDTNLANVNMDTPAQRESQAWLDGIHKNMPRFEDRNGKPVTMKTPLSDLPGFDR